MSKHLNRIVIVLITSALCMACSENSSTEIEESPINEEGQILEGEVIYSVEFPFISDPTLIKWFPTEYITTFNQHEIYGEMNSRMNVITNRFYSNQKNFELEQTLENMSGNYVSKLSHEDVKIMISQMPSMTITEPHSDTVIVGIPCKMSYAEFNIDSVPPVLLYYTDKIKIDSPNWFNQYHDLDEFLLGYEIEQFGMRMKLMAKEVNAKKTNISSEQIFASKDEKSYELLSGQELKKTVKEMLNDFMQ